LVWVTAKACGGAPRDGADHGSDEGQCLSVCHILASARETTFGKDLAIPDAQR
jgi:hypothetical protein